VKAKLQLFRAGLLLTGGVLAAGAIAFGQDAPEPAPLPAQTPASASVLPSNGTGGPLAAAQAAAVQVTSDQPALSPAVETLLRFRHSDIKFDVDRLMEILRDKRHEGWVLAAYPDPKTAQPLIGAGFSLDLPAREHPQRDALNAHPFLEPSSAELWQAAGLDPARLQRILGEFNDRLSSWNKKGFRRQIWSLEPQITDEDANALLRVGIIQSIYNAKAYCRNFDHLSASQQMAMTQLVYQMGVNLEEFSTFLDLINRGNESPAEAAAVAKADAAYWRSVQMSLVQSQWARLYRARATAVIAMLDPRYMDNPSGAEHSIGAILHPARVRKSHAAVRNAAYTRHHTSAARKRAARTRKN
jgi:GH24 family phage-related lysozyme (muramidase)